MAGTSAVDGVANPGVQQGAMRDLRSTATEMLAELRKLEQKYHRWLGSWLDQQEQLWSECQAAGTSEARVWPFNQQTSPEPQVSEVALQSVSVWPASEAPGHNSNLLAVQQKQPTLEDAIDATVERNGSKRGCEPSQKPIGVLPSSVTPKSLAEGGELAAPSELGTAASELATPGKFTFKIRDIFKKRSAKTQSDELTQDNTGPSSTSVGTKARKKKKRRVHNFNLMEANEKPQESRLKRFTKSRYYEVSSGLLIVVNAAYIGYQTQFTAEVMRDYRAGKRDTIVDDTVFFVFQLLFCVAFSVELVLRWAAEGLVDFFLLSSERGWNIFDATVVFFSVIDILLLDIIRKGKEKGDLLGNISVLRVLRVVRIVRVARVIRVMRFFRELRMMVFSILGSLKSLMWSFMVLGLCFYVFGISLTAGCTDHIVESTMDQDWINVESMPVLKFFGTLDRSILHLYMSITGGNDWSVYYEALEALPYQYRMFFMVFMFFTIIAVLNVVTGVFVETALSSGSTDREIMVHEEMEAKRVYQASMREFFEEADEDGTGNITYDEFTKKLKDERVIAYFNAFKLDVSDASLLFTLLDYDESGAIQIEEFLDGCSRLQGESRALDMKVMQLEVRFLKESFHQFANHIVEYLPLVLPRTKAPHHIDHKEHLQRAATRTLTASAESAQNEHLPHQVVPVIDQVNGSSQPREAWARAQDPP